MPQTKKAKAPAKVKAKAAKPEAKAKAVKSAGKSAPKAPAKNVKAVEKAIPKVAAKASVKAAEPAKALENSKVALKKETVSKDAATSVPVKPPKAPKVPRISAAALARAEKATDAANQLSAKWSSLYKKAESIEAKPYNMKSVYEEKTAIVHKILGWGYILANRNDRLEVLFKDGIKYLISNYKA
jgi:hypothetical protein